jgi:integrase
MAATEPIRDKETLKQMAGFWLKRGHTRNYAMMVLGLHTALRIADLLRLKWEDVYDWDSGAFRSHVTLVEKKTGKHKSIALNQAATRALGLHLPKTREEFIFANNRRGARAICRVQAWRIIRMAAKAIKAVGRIGCHSLRKTFGYFAWKAGALPVMLMDIFNHSSFETTKRYLGITQDDRDRVYLGMELV